MHRCAHKEPFSLPKWLQHTLLLSSMFRKNQRVGEWAEGHLGNGQWNWNVKMEGKQCHHSQPDIRPMSRYQPSE